MYSSLAVDFWALALRVARPVNRLVGWCTGGGRAALAGLALTAVAVAVFGNWEILVLYLLALLLIAAWHARRRIVIDEIADNTVDGALARGAAALLAVELARIGEAFQSVNAGRDIEMTSGIVPLEIATNLDDFAADLRSAVSAESKLSIGPVSFPVGALMAVLGRFVQAPRLSAVIHEEDGHAVLVARLTGAGRSGAWRVEAARDPDQDGRSESVVRGLVAELAVRVFTDVGLRGSTDWRATRHLVESVRHYRSAIRARGVSRLALLTAERELLEAVGRDQRLFEAYHDLGVVYVELDQGHARRAESAFRKAIEIDASRWEPYYALALTAFRQALADDGEIDAHEAAEIIDRCRRVIHMRPTDAAAANAHNVIGLVQRRRLDAPDPVAATRSREIASRLSLRALARAELGVGRRAASPASVRTLSDQAAVHLQNLAVAYAYLWHEAHSRLGSARWGRARLLDWLRFRRIAGLLTLSQRLSPANAELHFQHGKIASGWGRLEVAQRELHTAAQICPERSDIWIELANVRARLAQQPDVSADMAHMAVAALGQAMALVDPTVANTATVEAIRRVSSTIDADAAGPVNDMLAFMQQLAEIMPITEHTDEAEALLASMREADRDREAGVMCWLLGQAAAAGNALEEDRYREALTRWRAGRCAEDVRREGLHGELARALMRQGRFEEAIAEAQRGIGADALSQWDHAVLGAVHVETRDWVRARGAYYNALLLDPDNYEHHRSLGWCLWNLALELSDRDSRCATLAEAARHMEDGLALSQEPRTTGEDGEAVQRARFALRVHYELGRIYTDADRFAEAISHLLVAATSRAIAPLVRLYLGQAYRFADNVDMARAQLELAVEGLDPDATAIGAEVGDECTRDWLLAWLYEELARISVERDGDPRESRRHLDRARHHASLIGDDVDASPVLASCCALQGKLLFRAARFDQAIRELQKALTREVDAEFYVDLARTYEAKASFSAGADRQLAVRRGRDAAELAVRYDFSGRVAVAVEQVRARLDRLDEHVAADATANGQPAGVTVAPPAGATA